MNRVFLPHSVRPATHLNVVRVQFAPQLLSIDRVDGDVVRGVARHGHALAAQAEVGGRGELGTALQGAEQVAECRVDEQGAVWRKNRCGRKSAKK